MFYPVRTELGETFVTGLIYSYMRYAPLYAGIGIIIIRLFFYKQLNKSFICIFIAVLNISVLITPAWLFIFRYYDTQ